MKLKKTKTENKEKKKKDSTFFLRNWAVGKILTSPWSNQASIPTECEKAIDK